MEVNGLVLSTVSRIHMRQLVAQNFQNVLSSSRVGSGDEAEIFYDLRIFR